MDTNLDIKIGEALKTYMASGVEQRARNWSMAIGLQDANRYNIVI